MTLKVSNDLPKKNEIIIKLSHTLITTSTEQPANGPRSMIMIRGEGTIFISAPADGTDASLIQKYLIVLLRCPAD